MFCGIVLQYGTLQQDSDPSDDLLGTLTFSNLPSIVDLMTWGFGLSSELYYFSFEDIGTVNYYPYVRSYTLQGLIPTGDYTPYIVLCEVGSSCF